MAVTEALMAAPGPLGRELVLPWALGGLPHPIPPSVDLDGDLLEQAVELSRDLTAQVWDRPEDEALTASAQVLDRLRGVEPSAALEAIAALRQPDQAQAGVLLGLLAEIGGRLVSDGLLSNADMMWYFNVDEVRAAFQTRRHLASRRVGVQPWEPLVASVVLDHGTILEGVPAAGGVGAGARHAIQSSPEQAPPPRHVITAPSALPRLSQLLWDTSALVTAAGSPAAHVFETARSLGVPAVCGVDMGREQDVIVAVDGYAGVVGKMPLHLGTAVRQKHPE